jgi:endonuclease/exonuclease/phosphatase family metal-dependent hydrolase
MSATDSARPMAVLCLVFSALLTAACASVPPGAPDGDPEVIPWRVVSYNIHHGRGMDDRVDLGRIADVLRRQNPDIVALQEVDEGVERSGGQDQAARLGELLGMHHAFGSFMDYQGGRYGMAILSRCPISSSDPVRLTEGNEPRIALVAEIVQPDGSLLSVVNVHFDWVGDDGFRFAQAVEVAHLVGGLNGPWILAGDFNDQPGSRTLDLFHERAREAAKPRGDRLTFSSTEPRREIDFVFVSPEHGWRIGPVEVVDEAMASDHMPVVADLMLPGQRTAPATVQSCNGDLIHSGVDTSWD